MSVPLSTERYDQLRAIAANKGASPHDTKEVLCERLDEALDEVERVYQLLWGSRCVYCGVIAGADKQNQDIADAALKNHIESCTEHPMFKLRAQLAEAQQDTARLDYLENEDNTLFRRNLPIKRVDIDAEMVTNGAHRWLNCIWLKG